MSPSPFWEIVWWRRVLFGGTLRVACMCAGVGTLKKRCPDYM